MIQPNELYTKKELIKLTGLKVRDLNQAKRNGLKISGDYIVGRDFIAHLIKVNADDWEPPQATRGRQ